METVIISLGGSVIVDSNNINTDYILKLRDLIETYKDKKRFILVCGGGVTCKNYINSAKSAGVTQTDSLDSIGIRATRLNSELTRSIFREKFNTPDLLTDIDTSPDFQTVLFTAGITTGNTTDFIAVKLAKNYNASRIINISNVESLYDKDPNKYPDAKKIKQCSFSELQTIIGDKHSPGIHAVFDPIAVREASNSNLQLFLIPKNTENLKKVLDNQPDFIGTRVIG